MGTRKGLFIKWDPCFALYTNSKLSRQDDGNFPFQFTGLFHIEIDVVVVFRSIHTGTRVKTQLRALKKRNAVTTWSNQTINVVPICFRIHTASGKYQKKPSFQTVFWTTSVKLAFGSMQCATFSIRMSLGQRLINSIGWTIKWLLSELFVSVGNRQSTRQFCIVFKKTHLIKLPEWKQ